ncbi:MAG: DUF971 domain-containing protein [Candidatus Latescibacterota bacterium]|nr:MAG: DUF971 domain-containing protein [Candidatus Latescibacterota bacterium]
MAAMPSEIEKLGAREIKITWDDGHVSVYRNPELRFACSCALCVEETTGVRRLRREQVPEEIAPTAMELVGNYAVQITWNDGHATGIYTYDHLRQLCPCDDCRRIRGMP